VQNTDPVLLERTTESDAAVIADLYLASRADALPYLRRVHTDDQVRNWIRNVLLRRVRLGLHGWTEVWWVSYR